ncbi:hypothetical protein A4S06_07845 [Erysipelotrichaceae bacterium MTC7]|nr:hypothetical protein A4S06_07845 [Erysipelotrichaceae bacterium MTC7]
MKILVTGFEAFGNDAINPTEELLKQLPKEIQSTKIDTLLLPVVGCKTHDILKAAVKQNYDYIICFGLAGGASGLRIERVAINIDDYRIMDNDGHQPIDEPIETRGKNAYFATLPIKAIVEDLQAKHFEAMVSNSAGTYVCNHVMYEVLYFIETYKLSTRAGFVHVPYLDSQDKQPSLSLSNLVEATMQIIQTCRQRQLDIKVTGGQEH